MKIIRFHSALLFLLLILVSQSTYGQFDVEHLQVRLGYNLHNSYARHFNHLIDVFNNDRYPLEIQENISPINFLHGISFGGRYEITDGIFVEGVFKNRHQFLQAQYVDPAMYRKFLFRSNTLELGIGYEITHENWFRDYAGAGILIGGLSVFTDWDAKEGNPGSGNMFNIDQSAAIGISFNYEAQFTLTNFLKIYIRPVLQFSLKSHIRNLNDFMNPVIDESGKVSYVAKESDKYNSGTLNGVGIESGLILSLPK